MTARARARATATTATTIKMIVLTGAILLVGLSAAITTTTNTNIARAQIPAGTEQVGNFVGKISTFLGKDILVIIATPNGNGLTNASSVVLGNESGKPINPIGNETVVVAPINASKGNESGGIAIVPIVNGSTTVVTTNENGTHASTVETTNVTATHNGTIVVTPEPEPKPPVVTPGTTPAQTCTCHIANGTLTAKPAPTSKPVEHLPPQPVQSLAPVHQENSAVPPPIGK